MAQEALRLTAPVNQVPRRAAKDTSVGNLAVPKDTVVVCQFGMTSEATGAGPGVFDPSHWLTGPDGAAVENSEPGNWVLGGGLRKCVGKNVVMMELTTVLAAVGREVGGVSMSAEDADVTFGVTSGHPTGLPVTLSPRQKQ